jgi:hypothetical protein
MTTPTSASLRLTFRFHAGGVDLVRVERLAKTAPGEALPTPEEGRNSGAWLVLLDAGGRPLFHRLLEDPFHFRAEHHRPGEPPEPHIRPLTPGEFQALVPALPDAAEVALVASPLDPGRQTEPALELARFPLAAAAAP